MDNNELINIAINARKNAKPVISKFYVGAALLCKDGSVYTGACIDDPACLRLGVCAERLAFFKAIEDNKTEFEKIAVVGGRKSDVILSVTPCGICRQFIILYAPDIDVVFLDKENNIKVSNIKELLPDGYIESFAKED